MPLTRRMIWVRKQPYTEERLKHNSQIEALARHLVWDLERFQNDPVTSDENVDTDVDAVIMSSVRRAAIAVPRHRHSAPHNGRVVNEVTRFEQCVVAVDNSNRTTGVTQDLHCACTTVILRTE
jgi:hypothetical protein